MQNAPSEGLSHSKNPIRNDRIIDSDIACSAASSAALPQIADARIESTLTEWSELRCENQINSTMQGGLVLVGSLSGSIEWEDSSYTESRFR